MRPLRKTIRIAVFAAALGGFVETASAQGFYIGGGAGGNFQAGGTQRLKTSTFYQDGKYDPGFAGGGSIGYEIGYGFRAEAEFGYRTNEMDETGETNASGDMRVISGMANMLYELEVDWAVKPFVGVGIGAANVEADGVTPFGPTSIDDDETRVAFQVKLGGEYALTDRLRLGLGYTYFRVPDVDFKAANGQNVDSEYESHAIMALVRFKFSKPPKPAPKAEAKPAPPPPPPPPVVAAAPPPAPPPVPRTYLVFFDWDSASLSTDGQGIVATAAANAKKTGAARIVATGHADRSGPQRYNNKLSMQRAEAVRAELVRQGIAANDIAIFAKGESEPLVPTDDGVREPQNRRVQIVLN